MKKLIAVLAAGCLMASSQVYAGDDWGWFAAGAAAGLVTGAVISDAHHHSHYYGCGHYGSGYGYGYGYYRPRPYYQYHTHYPGCGHYGYTTHVHSPGCGHYHHSEVYYY